MSELINTYKSIKSSVVAITSRLSKNPDFPDIIGTGFIAREDGLIFTNNHVINLFKRLPKRKSAPADEWPAVVFLFQLDPKKGTLMIPLEIKGVSLISKSNTGVDYGEKIPDIGVIRVDVNGLPTVEIEQEFNMFEGSEVALSGFPMGTAALRAPGWIHQISPTLQKGVISAILPMVCKKPHAFMMDIQVEGGSSGSPVFNPETGKVVGILYSGLIEKRYMDNPKEGTFIQYANSTSHSLAIPCNILYYVLNQIDNVEEFKEHKIKYRSLESIIKTSKQQTITPGKSWLQPNK